jgi:hypothetical protein
MKTQLTRGLGRVIGKGVVGAGAVSQLLWGGQSCPQPPFSRLLFLISRLKGGCSEDSLPHTI